MKLKKHEKRKVIEMKLPRVAKLQVQDDGLKIVFAQPAEYRGKFRKTPLWPALLMEINAKTGKALIVWDSRSCSKWSNANMPIEEVSLFKTDAYLEQKHGHLKTSAEQSRALKLFMLWKEFFCEMQKKTRSTRAEQSRGVQRVKYFMCECENDWV